jgi:hypothetical protein
MIVLEGEERDLAESIHRLGGARRVREYLEELRKSPAWEKHRASSEK